MENMELSREMNREAKIKTAQDLRQLRGDDDDRDQEAIRALEQIEMDKIDIKKNLISIKANKHKNAKKTKEESRADIMAVL